MIRNARIRSVDGRNDAGQYVYDAEWSDDGCPCTLRYVAAPGRYESYLVDDVVMVALPYGDHTAGRIIGLYESSQLEPADDGNTEVQARGDKSLRLSGTRVDVGPGDPDDQIQVGLHDQLRADIDALHNLLDAPLSALLGLIQIQVTAGGGGTFSTTSWDAAVSDATPSSVPAEGVYAKPEAS